MDVSVPAPLAFFHKPYRAAEFAKFEAEHVELPWEIGIDIPIELNIERLFASIPLGIDRGDC